jgi:surface protein
MVEAHLVEEDARQVSQLVRDLEYMKEENERLRQRQDEDIKNIPVAIPAIHRRTRRPVIVAVLLLLAVVIVIASFAASYLRQLAGPAPGPTSGPMTSIPLSSPASSPTASPTTSGHMASSNSSLPETPAIDPEPPAPSPCIQDTDELYTAVDMYLQDPTGASTADQYGHPIAAWCVSQIQNFSNVFSVERNLNALNFDEDISAWNISSAKTMYRMFAGASKFNHPLSSWHTASVTDMRYVFYGASAFNQPLADWNTRSVTTMFSMFESAASFNQNLSSWETSNVVDMSWMFFG